MGACGCGSGCGCISTCGGGGALIEVRDDGDGRCFDADGRRRLVLCFGERWHGGFVSSVEV